MVDWHEVYIAHCRKSGKSYIGFTCRTYQKRWVQHVREAASARSSTRGSVIHEAIRKHGVAAFEVSLLCRTKTRESAASKERYFIKVHNTLAPKGYNLTTGGDAAFVLSERSRQRLSRAVKGHIVTEETRRKLSLALKGRPNLAARRSPSPETRAKISAALKAKKIKLSPEQLAKMLAGRRAHGWFPSPEAIEKTRLKKLGVKTGPRPKWVREKISRALKGRGLGRTLPLKTRKLMKVAQRKRREREGYHANP